MEYEDSGLYEELEGIAGIEETEGHQIYRGRFHGRRGKFTTIVRLIYNGLSYNLGTIDGAVTVMKDFTHWRFIAPVDRFARDDFADMTLLEVLQEMANETASVPVPAWDDFFSFLGGREDLVNAAMLSNDVVRIGGVKVYFQMLGSCSDFCSFTRWLCDNVGEAGNLPAANFIVGQELMIPMDMHSAAPVSVTLRTPTTKPAYSTDTSLWGKQGDTFNDPVFFAGEYIYAFEPTTDKHGTTVPQGWSAVSGEETLSYTPYDMEKNPVTIPIEDGADLELVWQEKMFMDIEYDESTEVLDGTITFSFLA